MKKFDKELMNTAKVWRDRSAAIRTKVGACISKGGRVKSTGFNGRLPGEDNTCEETCPKCNGKGCLHCQFWGIVTRPDVHHAEWNAITWAEQDSIDLIGSEIHVTLAPCRNCAEKIVEAGLTRVVFEEIYRSTEGLEYLIENGIEVERYKDG